MKPAAFAYVRPDTVDEAMAALGEYGEDGKVLAGGQSLVATMNMRLARPAAIVDINRLAEIGSIRLGGGALHVGALVRQGDVERHEGALAAVPLLAQALPYVGHWQTRNRGTICGSLAHADPSAELPLVAVALGATIEARSRRGTRMIAADAFFDSYFTTALQADELVVGATFPVYRDGWGFAFEEFAERHGDFAIVAVACALHLETNGALSDLRLVLGGVDERPHAIAAARWYGRAPSDADVVEIADAAVEGIEPPDDLRGSREYRRSLARAQAQRALTRALADARSPRPESRP